MSRAWWRSIETGKTYYRLTRCGRARRGDGQGGRLMAALTARRTGGWACLGRRPDSGGELCRDPLRHQQLQRDALYRQLWRLARRQCGRARGAVARTNKLAKMAARAITECIDAAPGCGSRRSRCCSVPPRKTGPGGSRISNECFSTAIERELRHCAASAFAGDLAGPRRGRGGFTAGAADFAGQAAMQASCRCRGRHVSGRRDSGGL